MLGVACVANAFAFSLGTLVGVAGLSAVPLVAAGVLVAMLVRLRQDLFQVGLTCAVVFVVGVGLPGGSEQAAYGRFWLILLGGGVGVGRGGPAVPGPAPQVERS